MANARFRYWAITLLVCLPAISGTTAKADDDPRDRKILDELSQATSIDFRDVPLIDGLTYLEDLHDMAIAIDEDALKMAKIDRVVPLTYKSPRRNDNSSNFPLYKAMWEMLGGHNLSFMIKDHELTITTAKAAEQWQKDYVKLVEMKK